VYLCGAEELAFLSHAAAREGEKMDPDEITDSPLLDIFRRNRFIYLFLYRGEYRVVLPRELAEIYREITAEEGFAAANARYRDMSDYAAAMLNMYGACDVMRFVDVWNHHRKDKVTREEALEFLRRRADFHFDYYWMPGDFLVHDSLQEDEFGALREVTKNATMYCMPTKRVIREYSANGYDRPELPGQKEMDAFLAEYVQDSRSLEELRLTIRFCSERMVTPEQFAGYLKTTEVPLGDAAFRVGFERLYNRMRDAAHIWPLSGLTLYEYQQESGKKVPRFELPELKGLKKKGKVRHH
jgi:hypothetical protein